MKAYRKVEALELRNQKVSSLVPRSDPGKTSFADALVDLLPLTSTSRI